MKLTGIFNSIKTRIDNDSIKLITWHNNQLSEGVIHTTPIVLIDFPNPITLTQLNKQTQQGDLSIVIHLINKLHSNHSGDINDSIILSTENIAESIYNKLQGFSIDDSSGPIITNSLTRSFLEYDLEQPGWIDIIQEFNCMIYQQNINDYRIIDKPPAIIT